MLCRTLLACALGAVAASSAGAQGSLVLEEPESAVKVAGFLTLGPSFANINMNERVDSENEVGAQFGVVSLSIELRVLFHERFGFAVTPLSWQPSGGAQEGTDHWRFVRIGGGPRLQLMPRDARAQLTLGYDLSFLRATDVQFCFVECRHDEPQRTFKAVGHSLSLRFDTPIASSAARIGARLEGGVSNDATMSWVTLGVSLGFGQR